MTWHQTHRGYAIDLLNPDLDQIQIEDIAYSLAHINRYTGHTGTYSVAQHSVFMADRVPFEFGLEALLHDAHEAFVGDVSSPLKDAMRKLSGRSVTPYDLLERIAANAVRDKYGLPRAQSEEIKLADRRMIATELRDLHVRPPKSWGVEGVEPYPDRIQIWEPDEAYRRFLIDFDYWMRKRGDNP